MIETYPFQNSTWSYNYYYYLDNNNNCRNMEGVKEQIIMVSPIHEPQSDSDNSDSSSDVTIKETISVIKNINNVQCCWEHCGELFESLEKLGEHVTQTHASSGPNGLYYCGWKGCTRNQRGFNARYKMLVHVRTHTHEKPHQCCQCDKSFSRAENLKIHSRSHSGEKPYTCPVPGCHKAYSNSSDRFKHTRTHQVEKPYYCKVSGCQKRYTDPSSLRKHVKTYRHFVDNKKDNEITDQPCRQTVISINNNYNNINERCISIHNQNKIKEQNKINIKQLNMYNINYKNSGLSNTQFQTSQNHPSVIVTNKNSFNEMIPIREQHDCNCTHSYHIGTLLDLSVSNIKNNKWTKLWNPYIDTQRNEQMEIDSPLDLSLSKK